MPDKFDRFEALDKALKNYDKVNELIPGYKWGEDTAVILQAAKEQLKLLDAALDPDY